MFNRVDGSRRSGTGTWAAVAVLVMVAGLVWVPVPAGGVAGFGDVDSDQFFTEPVQWMVDNGITTGTSPTCFSPGDPVTRGQAAAFMWRMEGSPTGAPAHSFVDVTAVWQQDPVSWMVQQGITTGTSPTTYSPENPVTRGDLAALLHRLAGEPDAPPPVQFPDVVKSYQITPVGWMVQEGITTGTSASTFSPDATVTRGQIATFFYRYKGSPPVVVDPDHPATPPCEAQVPGSLPGEGVLVTIARADWSTGYFQAYVYQALLEELGYEVTDPADLELGPSLAYLSMAQGDFDFWVNSWYPGHISWWEPELTDGSQVGDHLTAFGPAPDNAGTFASNFEEQYPGELVAGGLQGYLITKGFAEEFGITTMDEFNANPAAIAAYDAQDPVPGNGVADIYGCQENWVCDNIILNQIAFGDGAGNPWGNIREVIAGYDAMVAEAVAKANAGEPAIIYTWTPSAYITELRPGDNMVWLGVDAVLDDSNPAGQAGGEAHSQLPGTASIGKDQCPSSVNNTCQLGWIAADILATANTEFAEANPAAATLIGSVVLSVIDVSLANVAQSAGAGTNEAIRGLADGWIANNRATVDPWLAAARAAAG